MTENVYEPLARYRDEFCKKFAALTDEKFQELTQRSDVNIRANRKLVFEIKKLRKQAASVSFRKSFYRFLMIFAFVVGGVAIIGAMNVEDLKSKVGISCIIGAAAGVILGIFMIPLFRAVSATLDRLNRKITEKMDLAWKQMDPLNRLYTWDLTAKLIEATVPELEFDPYFSAKRLNSLQEQFGWNDSFNKGKSIIFAQSGVIKGNPFVFGHYLDMEWGQKTYYGSKKISWVEWERGADGKQHRVCKHQTLRAEVTKPLPVYKEEKFLLYGNDAAPKLSFSRRPSGFSGSESGFWSGIRKKWRLSRLKAYSRNLDDDSNFTLMSNHEFETWFHAKDRDDEVEFRLLFTPVAQIQMLNLMKDTSIGYGDDFTFIKKKKINLLFSKHLSEASIDTDPARFRSWDYDESLKTFRKFNIRYFKDAYFALAPLLSIPVYQQVRTHEEIWKGTLSRPASSFWEQEAVANYHGEKQFAHPACVTRSILKTKEIDRGNGESTVAVTAHGFRGVERIDYKEVRGDDGNWHDVPVHWIEYLPIEKTTRIYLSEAEIPTEGFLKNAKFSYASVYRRSILSYIPK